jgi:hypothetical protein
MDASFSTMTRAAGRDGLPAGEGSSTDSLEGCHLQSTTTNPLFSGADNGSGISPFAHMGVQQGPTGSSDGSLQGSEGRPSPTFRAFSQLPQSPSFQAPRRPSVDGFSIEDPRWERRIRLAPSIRASGDGQQASLEPIPEALPPSKLLSYPSAARLPASGLSDRGDREARRAAGGSAVPRLSAPGDCETAGSGVLSQFRSKLVGGLASMSSRLVSLDGKPPLSRTASSNLGPGTRVEKLVSLAEKRGGEMCMARMCEVEWVGGWMEHAEHKPPPRSPGALVHLPFAPLPQQL